MSKEEIVIDFNNPVWSAPPIRGMMRTNEGEYCAVGKFVYSSNLKGVIDSYSAARRIFGGRDERDYLISINDSSEDEKENHIIAIKKAIEILSKNPKVKFIGKPPYGLKYGTIKKTVTKAAKQENVNMGTVLKNKRQELGLSLAQLAKKANVGLTTISDLENGRHTPQFSTLSKVVKALNS